MYYALRSRSNEYQSIKFDIRKLSMLFIMDNIILESTVINNECQSQKNVEDHQTPQH